MPYPLRKFNNRVLIIVIALILSGWFFPFSSYAAPPTIGLLAQYTSGPQVNQIPSVSLIPGTNVKLTGTFDYYGAGEPCSKIGTIQTYPYWVMVRYRDGNSDNKTLGNMEFLSGGGPVSLTNPSTWSFSHTFNSGVDGQKNVYQAVYYCWAEPRQELALASTLRSPVFNLATVQPACNLSGPVWSGGTTVGQSTAMRVNGDSGCAGRSLNFEVWQRLTSGDNKVSTISALFSSSGTIVASGNWTPSQSGTYYFKAVVPDPKGVTTTSPDLTVTASGGGGSNLADFTAAYTSGPFVGQTPSGGLEPNSAIRITATFHGNASAVCSGGTLPYQLYWTMAHAIAGNLNDLEYLGGGGPATGTDPNFTYDFNSGTYGQRNVYWPIFYCWSSNVPQIALGTARQWTSGGRFDQTTVGGVCAFSNAVWSNGSPKVGDAVNLTVNGTTAGCRGVNFQFEIWRGTSDCKGVGNQQSSALSSSFPASGTPPLSAQTPWTVPDTAQYCFKIRESSGHCADDGTGGCLWSGRLKASAGATSVTTSTSTEFPNPLNASTLGELLNAILYWIFWLSIPIAVAIILYAGFMMLYAQGDPAKFKQGRTMLLWAVVGLAVVLIGRGFISLIESIINLKN